MLQQYRNILVPVDGSNEARLAFKKGVAIALRNGADCQLHLIHVIDTRAFQNVANFDTELVDQVANSAKKILDEYVDYAKKQGLTNIDASIEYGAPKAVIAKNMPEKFPASLIVMGATGLNAVERILIGSVTEYVTRVAPCDVLVVRTDLDNHIPEKKQSK